MSQHYFYPSAVVSFPPGDVAVNIDAVGGQPVTLGQKTMANSFPVVIASDQSILSVTGPLTDTQLRATPVPVSGTVTANQGTSPWVSSISNFPATQSVTQGTTPWIVDASGFPVPVTGPLTDTQLRATPVPISGTVTADAGTGNFTVVQATGTNLHVVVDSGTIAATQSGTWNINNISGTVSLPTGAATETTLSSIDGKLNSLGQKAMAASVPVVLASDQTAIPVDATPATTSGTLTQAAVTVGTSAVRCTVSGSAPSAVRKALIVEPDPASTAKFYIGSSSVTSSGATRGISLAPGAQFIADFDSSDFYIISDTAGQTFFVVEEV